jgi:hypothetical protein
MSDPAVTSELDLELGRALAEDGRLEERLVGLLAASRTGQLIALSIVAVHRDGVVETVTSGRRVAGVHLDPRR